MSAPPFRITLSDKVNKWAQDAKTNKRLERKYDKFKKTIKLLRDVGPRHTGLKTHAMKTWCTDDGKQIWNSYVENGTPSAWRMYWIYDGPDTIHVLSVGPHDHTI